MSKDWHEWPLLPAVVCPECERTKPDIEKKHGRWVRVRPGAFCSETCSRKATRIGGYTWAKSNHPDKMHLLGFTI